MARQMPPATIALFDLPADEQLDLFAEPAEPAPSLFGDDGNAPVWVRVCGHVGCRLTNRHTHGIKP